MINKKVKRNTGDIVKISLEDGDFCFGCILDEPLILFYDFKANYAPPVEVISKLPVLFEIWVMNSAITSGKWEVVGYHDVDSLVKGPTRFFKEDIISKKFFLCVGAEEIPATHEQCIGLERAAVWSPEHVEDRLRDHYLGVSNKWVESLRLK